VEEALSSAAPVPFIMGSSATITFHQSAPFTYTSSLCWASAGRTVFETREESPTSTTF
jgi:hypothetical protein